MLNHVLKTKLISRENLLYFFQILIVENVQKMIILIAGNSKCYSNVTNQSSGSYGLREYMILQGANVNYSLVRKHIVFLFP